MVGIERAERQTLSMEVAKSLDDGIEDFARFLPVERRSAERSGEGIVGRLEEGSKDDSAAVAGTPAIEKFDQIRMTELASSMPEPEWRGAIEYRLRYQLYDRTAAPGSQRRLKIRGAVIAAQPSFQRVIPGEGHTLPMFTRSEEHTSELQSLRHLV